MKKTRTYSKLHHVMEQPANTFDDVLERGKLNPTFSSGESSSTANSPNHTGTSMEEEDFLTISQKNYSGAAVSKGLCKKQEQVNKRNVVHVTPVTSDNTFSARDDNKEALFHEEESFISGKESRYTYVDVTVTNTDYLSSPELVREEERPQSDYPAAQSLLFEDLKAKICYTDDTSLLSDEDDYASDQLFSGYEEPKVDSVPKPKFTSTLLDPATANGEELMGFSQVLSTICGADSGLDENSCSKQVPERAAGMRSNIGNRKAFTIKARPRVSLEPKTSTRVFDQGEKPEFCWDDLSSFIMQPPKDVYQPSATSCETNSGKLATLSDVSMKKQPCDTNSNQSPHSRSRIVKMTSTPNPEGMPSPFTLNLSPINSTCSSSELEIKQSLIVDSDEIVAMDTDSEQEMWLAKAEINQIRKSKTTDSNDVCCKTSGQTVSPCAFSVRNTQKQSTVEQSHKIPLCCIAEFPDKCTNLPGPRLIKTTESTINTEIVPDDILESFGENPH